jgi:Cd(II)/Pb(II)-responsive transcriptional regulator
MRIMHTRIGDLAGSTGVKVETIRYYERAGLLPAPPRSEGNYRLYGDAHQARLRFILHCRTLGLPLAAIRRLLALKDNPKQSCADADQLVDGHLAQVRERIQALQALEAALQQLRRQCGETRAAADWGILKNLSEPPPCVRKVT